MSLLANNGAEGTGKFEINSAARPLNYQRIETHKNNAETTGSIRRKSVEYPGGRQRGIYGKRKGADRQSRFLWEA